MPNIQTIAIAPAASASGNVTAETAFCNAPGNTVRTFLTMPAGVSNASLDGHELLLRVSILATTAGSFTYGPSIRLYSGSNTGLLTFTSDTAVVTPSAPTIATATRLLCITARMSWDPATARLNGSYCFNVDTTYTNWVTLTAGLSAGVTNASNIAFCVTGIFGTTGANTALLKCFELDLI